MHKLCRCITFSHAGHYFLTIPYIYCYFYAESWLRKIHRFLRKVVPLLEGTTFYVHQHCTTRTFQSTHLMIINLTTTIISRELTHPFKVVRRMPWLQYLNTMTTRLLNTMFSTAVCKLHVFCRDKSLLFDVSGALMLCCGFSEIVCYSLFKPHSQNLQLNATYH